MERLVGAVYMWLDEQRPERTSDVTDEALIDLWWTTCGDSWAIPDDLMVKFGRAAAALAARNR
jgi:hypothetical protein